MDQTQFNAAIDVIVSALQTAGYDPYVQLRGFADTGSVMYITRENGARDLASQLDPNRIQEYLKAQNKY